MAITSVDQLCTWKQYFVCEHLCDVTKTKLAWHTMHMNVQSSIHHAKDPLTPYLPKRHNFQTPLHLLHHLYISVLHHAGTTPTAQLAQSPQRLSSKTDRTHAFDWMGHTHFRGRWQARPEQQPAATHQTSGKSPNPFSLTASREASLSTTHSPCM
jgi:hypothetical protein